MVEVELGHLRGPQRVLLVRHLLDRVERLGVGPAEVRVRLAHAGHQGRAGAVDHRHPGVATLRPPRPTRAMRLPWISTSPG